MALKMNLNLEKSHEWHHQWINQEFVRPGQHCGINMAFMSLLSSLLLLSWLRVVKATWAMTSARNNAANVCLHLSKKMVMPYQDGISGEGYAMLAKFTYSGSLKITMMAQKQLIWTLHRRGSAQFIVMLQLFYRSWMLMSADQNWHVVTLLVLIPLANMALNWWSLCDWKRWSATARSIIMHSGFSKYFCRFNQRLTLTTKCLVK